MKSETRRESTELLRAWGTGDPEALEELTRQAYAELRKIARRYMAGERSDHTLQTSALINEAYLRLGQCRPGPWSNRSQFFALCAQLMRRILVDHARARASRKRGGNLERLNVEPDLLATASTSRKLVELDDALTRLADVDPRKSRVVELRAFGGLNVEEVAEAMDIAVITVKRDWSMALAWLRRELDPEKLDES